MNAAIASKMTTEKLQSLRSEYIRERDLCYISAHRAVNRGDYPTAKDYNDAALQYEGYLYTVSCEITNRNVMPCFSS